MILYNKITAPVYEHADWRAYAANPDGVYAHPAPHADARCAVVNLGPTDSGARVPASEGLTALTDNRCLLKAIANG